MFQIMKASRGHSSRQLVLLQVPYLRLDPVSEDVLTMQAKQPGAVLNVMSRHFSHCKTDTTAFGPCNRDTKQDVLQAVPSQPEKTYLVIIRGPNPGIYHDFSYKVDGCLRRLEVFHIMAYTTEDEDDANEVFSLAAEVGLVASEVRLKDSHGCSQ
ncbi:hypothetical protein BDR03DRAFT_180937 [Suillus americanus]|nr:hypothetical protein BDR03DRAFT_180937 [Suillus americanus]